MALTKEERGLIQETRDTTIELKTALCGINGKGGLMNEVKDIKLNVNGLNKSHTKLKRNFYILITALLGTGALGTGIWSLFGN